MFAPLLLAVLVLTTVASTQASADGVVVEVMGDRVTLSLGSADGIVTGQRCVIYRRESFSHPVTDEAIVIPRLLVADAEVKEAGAVFSTAIVTWSEMPIRRGDLVRVGDRDALAQEDRPATTGAGSASVSSPPSPLTPPTDASAHLDSLNTVAKVASAALVRPVVAVSTVAGKRQRPAPLPKPARRPVVSARTKPATTALDSLGAKTTGVPSGRKTDDIMSPAGSELEDRYEEAVSSLKGAGQKGAGGNVDAHYWVGMKHFRMNDFPTASEHFKKVIAGRAEPSIRQKALFNLAMCYYQMNKNEPAKLDQAKALFRQIVQEFPGRAIDASQWIETIEWLQRAGTKRQQQMKTGPATQQRESANELARNNH